MKTWIIESIEGDSLYPYRLTLKVDGKDLLILRTQTLWPEGNDIYCRVEPEIKEHTDLTFSTRRSKIGDILESVPIVELKRHGKKIAVILDRTQRKRCEFTLLKQQYLKKRGNYERILWRSQVSLRTRRPSAKLTNYYDEPLDIIIDTREQKPWSFPGNNQTVERLRVGDYALTHKGGILAVVERKSTPNFLLEISNMSAFHLQLVELKSLHPNAAIVIENSYEGIGDAGGEYYEPEFIKKALGELEALHRDLKVVYASSRAGAQEWVVNYFRSLVGNEVNRPSRDIIS